MRSAGESDGPRVVCVANYIERKNLPRLLEAFARARSAWGGGSLALVGDGPSRASWRRSPRDLGIAGSVRFVGAPPEEVPRWLRACDVACLVSTVEGFGLAPIEALACGRPVVVSREVPSGAAVTEGARAPSATPRRRRDGRLRSQLAATLTPGEERRCGAALRRGRARRNASRTSSRHASRER